MKGVDEAFCSLGETVLACTDVTTRFEGVVGDERVVVSAESIGIETPIEMSIAVSETGEVAIGCAPPLYAIEVTDMPVFHTLRFTVVADEAGHE